MSSVSRHYPVLDGWRAIAILLVIPHNVSVLGGHLTGAAHLVAIATNVGWVGVQLFFALSGFLITGNLLDTQRSANYYRAFFGRRILRIFPLYFAALFLILIVVPLAGLAPPQLTATLHYQAWLWLFLSNWAIPFSMTVVGFSHFWSLAIEEQFYLVWPSVVHRAAPLKVVRISIGVAIAAFVIRCVFVLLNVSHDVLYMFTMCRMDALAAGAAAAAFLRIPSTHAWIAERTGKLMVTTLVLLAVGAAVTDVYAIFSPLTQTFGYSLLAICFATLVALATLPAPRFAGALYNLLASAPLRAVGRYSYAMYVIHLPLHIFIGVPLLHRYAPELTHGMAFLYLGGVLVVTFALSALSYRYFESPFLRLKRNFEPQTSAAPLTEAT